MPNHYYEQLDEEMHRRGALGNDTSLRVALERICGAIIDRDRYYSEGDTDEFGDSLRNLVCKRVVGFSTAIMSNSGNPSAPAASCTVLSLKATTQDSIDLEHFFNLSKEAFDYGVGIGYDLSTLSSLADVMGQMDEQLERINGPLVLASKRPVASMMTLSALHPKVFEFIELVSKPNRGRLATCSLFITEDIFDRAKRGLNMPEDTPYGAWAESIPAKDLIRLIASAIHSSGNPGILFADRFETDNATPIVPYVSTAPCAEVGLASGDACHFGYVNLLSLVQSGAFDWVALKTAVRTLTRALDATVDMTIGAATSFPLVSERRRIGVCMTGLSDCFDALGMDYESVDAERLAQSVSETIDYESKVESVRLAKSRGPFPMIDQSRYRDPTWVKRKFHNSVVHDLNWPSLFADIGQVGIRNSSTTALSSAETASALFGVSTSLEPDRFPSVLSVNCEFDPMMRRKRLPNRVSALSQLRIQAAIQKFLDDAISKTITLPTSATVDDIEDILFSAYTLNLRGIAIYREPH